jgi:4-aminobutyrate aminotransferase-like enzyme
MTKVIPGPKAKAILERGIPIFQNGLIFNDKMQKALKRGFRPAGQVMVDKALGDHIWDVDGNKYIDFQNGWATNPIGNAHPEIIEAIHEAQKRYGFHYDHPLRYELAEKITQITPEKALSRFNYEVSGTEAAESAFYMAMCYKKRRHVITFASSFHGNSLGTKTFGGLNTRKYMEGWNGGAIIAPYPHSDHIPAGMTEEQYSEYCLHYLEHHIPNYIAAKDNIAAIMVEPGLAEGGNWIPTKSFLQGIRAICDRNDWLMIADEVLTGLGRTAKMWAVEHYDVVPDILVIGKNLSGGVEACAGVAARDEILGNNPDFSASSTFAGTPAGCAAGLKTLEIFKRDNIIDHAAKLAEIAKIVMSKWESKYEIVRQVRLSGLLLGVSFQAPADKKDDDNWWYARAVRNEMLHTGVWAISDREENIRMYPALNMNIDTFKEGLSIMEAAIAKIDCNGQDLGNSPAWPSGDAGF